MTGGGLDPLLIPKFPNSLLGLTLGTGRQSLAYLCTPELMEYFRQHGEEETGQMLPPEQPHGDKGSTNSGTGFCQLLSWPLEDAEGRKLAANSWTPVCTSGR